MCLRNTIGCAQIDKDGSTVISKTIDPDHFVVPVGPQNGFLALPRVFKISRRLGRDQKLAENSIHPRDPFELPDHEGSIGIESNDKTEEFVRCRRMSKGDRHDDQPLAVFAIQYQLVVTIALEAKHLSVDRGERCRTTAFASPAVRADVFAGSRIQRVFSHYDSKIRHLVGLFPIRSSLPSSTSVLLDSHDKDFHPLLRLEAGLRIDQGDLKGTLASMIAFFRRKIRYKGLGVVAFVGQNDVNVGKSQQKVVVTDPKGPVVGHGSGQGDPAVHH
mmetsp:Transcript_20801/g.57768  ORF Transcript_20801/g.57768 Transcript_20801/m.57768 type:complete len:274 (-) Transcript_20801:643-1464(-)